ncbi:YnhF family membrane protein [Acerihabitans sp. TG2]
MNSDFKISLATTIFSLFVIMAFSFTAVMN